MATSYSPASTRGEPQQASSSQCLGAMTGGTPVTTQEIIDVNSGAQCTGDNFVQLPSGEGRELSK